MALQGYICLVTGATRGIGKGIALQLGEAGATVYITGRTLNANPESHGSLEETAKEIEARGGTPVAVQVDHANMSEVEKLFERIKTEQDGRLDILVNNAYAAVSSIMKSIGKPFWEVPPEEWDTVNNVGLRNHYFCTVHAARMMVPRKKGLIVNISSIGGWRYLFNVPYGIGKCAMDRMAADCAYELKKHNVAMVSLWPGAVKTELMVEAAEESKEERLRKMLEIAETTEFSGICITRLALDENIMSKSGRVLQTGDLADEYGLKDIDGKYPLSMRCFSIALHQAGWIKTASYLPRWCKFPGWIFAVFGSKY